MKKYLIVFLGLFSYQVFGIEYYCSRSDVYFEYLPNPGAPFGVLADGIDGYSDVYQNNPAKGDSSSGHLSFKVKDCSVKNFECLHLLKKQSNKEDIEFYLFVPRFMEENKEYYFNGMKLLTKIATISPFITQGSQKNKIPILQATIWQKINGVETPIKITIEENKGIIFWDGLNIWPEKFNIGETCALQSAEGFFADIKIKEITFSGEVKTD